MSKSRDFLLSGIVLEKGFQSHIGLKKSMAKER